MIIERRDKRPRVHSVSYEMFRYQSVAVKFRLRLSAKAGKDNPERFFQQSYITADNHISTVLSGTGVIDISVKDMDTSASKYVSMNEFDRDRFVNKLIKVYNTLCAYSYGDVDILVPTSVGVKIHPELSTEISVPCQISSNVISVKPVFDETLGCVVIRVAIDDFVGQMALNSFLSAFCAIKNINYATMCLQLMNYYSTLEQVDGDIIQLNQNDNQRTSIAMTGFDGGSNKQSIMGSLCDIEVKKEDAQDPMAKKKIDWS